MIETALTQQEKLSFHLQGLANMTGAFAIDNKVFRVNPTSCEVYTSGEKTEITEEDEKLVRYELNKQNHSLSPCDFQIKLLNFWLIKYNSQFKNSE
jgi:hypothetical protein